MQIVKADKGDSVIVTLQNDYDNIDNYFFEAISLFTHRPYEHLPRISQEMSK